MTIYNVWFTNFQSEDEWVAAFSSYEKAADYISRFKSQEELFTIVEYSLDSE